MGEARELGSEVRWLRASQPALSIQGLLHAFVKTLWTAQRESLMELLTKHELRGGECTTHAHYAHLIYSSLRIETRDHVIRSVGTTQRVEKLIRSIVPFPGFAPALVRAAQDAIHSFGLAKQ